MEIRITTTQQLKNVVPSRIRKTIDLAVEIFRSVFESEIIVMAVTN